jgi:Fungal Zn(2)-Cys(6) binuclear cluster domain
MADHEPPSATPPPRKRRRPAKSCEQCRSRKIRCDQEVPCGPCVRARSSLLCSYSPAVPGNQSSADRSHSVSNPPLTSNPALPPITRTPQSQLPDLDAEIRVAEPDQTRSSLQPPSLLSQHDQTIRDLQQRLQRLEEQLSSRELNHASTVPDPGLAQAVRDLNNRVLRAEQQLSESPHGPQPAPPATSRGSSIPATLPRLRIAPDKTKLFGQSHWVHTAEKV